MTNHGCKFDWCANELDSHPGHLLEHFADYKSIPATGGCSPGRDATTLPVVMVSTRFNEDIEAIQGHRDGEDVGRH